MQLTSVAIATFVGLGLLAVAGGGSPSAQVVGITLGAPFKTVDGPAAGVLPPAAAYSPYVSRGDELRGLTPETVEAHLRQRGFSNIANLQRRGGTYICEASGPRRERVRLVVDAASGEISGVQVIGFEDKRY